MKVKRIYIKGLLAFVLLMLSAGPLNAEPLHQRSYARLIEFIQMQDKEAPLFVFDDYEVGFDSTSHKANLEYLNTHPGLIKKIRSDLDGAALRWQLKMLQHRLLFVPEKRQEYARLYESYCRDVIRFVLSKTQLPNPFVDIRTLSRERPDLASHMDGVTVFLVHNLAKEFQAINLFTSLNDKKAELKLAGKIFVGNIGSYASQISFQEDGGMEFSRSHYTIWQNSAKNPYTALMTPAEETLHVLLRPYTEKAIEEKIKLLPQKNDRSVRALVDDWVAVEEAVAGGLAYVLMTRFLDQHIPDFPFSLIEADLEEKMKREKYRHLENGIDLVKNMGHKSALGLYQSNPNMVRNLLMDPPFEDEDLT